MTAVAAVADAAPVVAPIVTATGGEIVAEVPPASSSPDQPCPFCLSDRLVDLL